MQNDAMGSLAGDCEIVVKVKVAALVTNDPYVMLCSTVTSGNGISLVYTGSGGWRLIDWRNGLYDYLAANLASHFTPSVDTYFWIRLGRVDSTDTIRFNVGTDEASVGTGSWDQSTASITAYTSGKVALQAYDCYNAGAAPKTFDLVGIGDGEEAPTHVASRTSVATDNFNVSSLSSNWTQINPEYGSMTIYGSARVASSHSQPPSNAQAARWNANSFANDQYSSLKIEVLTWLGNNYHVGVICRASGDTNGNRDLYYVTVANVNGGSPYYTAFGKIVNGTHTSFHVADVAWTVGSRIELECEGTTIRAMKDAVALGGSFTQTDSSLTSGNAGIYGGGGDYVAGDDWEGGDLNVSSAFKPQYARNANIFIHYS
jgi:hypothetical protein